MSTALRRLIRVHLHGLVPIRRAIGKGNPQRCAEAAQRFYGGIALLNSCVAFFFGGAEAVDDPVKPGNGLLELLNPIL